MCLIIFTRNLKRARLTKAILDKAYNRNMDGVGISYIEDGVVKVSKGFDYFDDFYTAFRPLRAKIGSGACLIHFRAQSVGLVNDGNTQPVVIHPGSLVMAHNGTFESLKGGDDSDSVKLASNIKRLGWTFPFTKPQTQLLSMLCAGRSKLVFLDASGRHLIINEQLGKWSRGAWYSDGGDVLEKESQPSTYGETKWPPKWRESAYSTYGGNAELHGGFNDDDVTYGAERDPLPRLRPHPLIKQMPGVGPRTTVMAPQQRADILMAKCNAKRWSDIDPDDLNGVDWREYVEVRRLLTGTSTLTS